MRRIVFFGTPQFAVPSLDLLYKSGCLIAGVVTVPDKPAGRGYKLQTSPVKDWAVEHGIPLLQPVKLSDPDFLDQLKSWQPELQVVVAFRFLPEVVWSLPPLGTFNLHASLLPQYRGAAPINWAVIRGETTTGITTFMLDHQIDTGKIIHRLEIPVLPSDNAGTLHDRMMTQGAELVVKTCADIFEGKVHAIDQQQWIKDTPNLFPAPKLTRELCRIDWTRPATDIHNLIRGLAPYPTAASGVYIDGELKYGLKIYESRVGQPQQGKPPGSVECDGKREFMVAASDAWIHLLLVQPEGRKPVRIHEWISGLKSQMLGNISNDRITLS